MEDEARFKAVSPCRRHGRQVSLTVFNGRLAIFHQRQLGAWMRTTTRNVLKNSAMAACDLLLSFALAKVLQLRVA
jgi:hypothetical protein